MDIRTEYKQTMEVEVRGNKVAINIPLELHKEDLLDILTELPLDSILNRLAEDFDIDILVDKLNKIKEL